ncbi:2TM domain-containing protein [Gaetbulibacter aestuarii]|uniref:2TM domain-containing protein n=1 Tax=Gaetbulibacter aestuarii TaxID=1502358 RepID=A0ABW7N078_9FLAO
MPKFIKNIVISFLIGCAIFVVANIYRGGFQYQNFNEALISFLVYQLYSFVIGYSNGYFFELLKRFRWKSNQIIWRIVIGVFGSTIITLLDLFVLRATTNYIFYGESFREFLSGEKLVYYKFGLVVTLIIVAIFHLVYFYNRYQQNKIKEQKVIAGTASAKFDALKNQLDPHFLFNSLNVLSSLIEENTESAQKFTTALSKVYRYVLEQKNKELVTVDEELDFAKTYMSLVKMRFEDSIIFEMPEKAENPESKVVPLALQLLLENAVKHNMVTSKKPLHIKIYEENGYLVVQNNLQPKQILKKSSGVGLSNIKQRYNLLTNKKVKIIKESQEFAVAIPMLSKQITIMENYSQFQKEANYVRAREYVEELKGFYYSLVAYCLVIPFLIWINYRTSWDYQWFWFPLFGWGLGLTINAYRVFIDRSMFGKSWEDRKIQQFMQEEEETKWE